jgi:hypothetical protein
MVVRGNQHRTDSGGGLFMDLSGDPVVAGDASIGGGTLL